MRSWSTGWAALMFILIAQTGFADVPRLIHYQGKLRDSGGAAVDDTVSVRFRLYDGPGGGASELFNEFHGSVTVTSGLFSMLIGSESGGVGDSALDAGEVWLGVAINEGDELSPRTRIGSTAHSLKSQSAEQLVRAGTFDAMVTVDAAGNVVFDAPDDSGGQVTVRIPLVIEDGAQGEGKVLTSDANGLANWQDAASGGEWSDGGSYIFANNATDVVVTDGGAVGVGTTSPSHALEVQATAGDVVRFAGAPGVVGDLVNWQQATANAPWEARNGHAPVEFSGRIWFFGRSGPFTNDVWYSTDGYDWQEATSAAAWSGRGYNSSLAYGGRMWLMGGFDPNFTQDIWYSTNGVNWSASTTAVPWGNRGQSAWAVFDGRMWMLGGYAGGGTWPRDVWHTTDGTAWTRATATAAWPDREGHGGAGFLGRLWLVGGSDGNSNYKNDVWYSTDGTNWSAQTMAAPWPRRVGVPSVVWDDKFWIVGGGQTVDPMADVWYTEDMQTWVRATAAAPWTPRNVQLALTAFGPRLWIVGGYDGTVRNDVWYLEGPQDPVTIRLTETGNLGIGTETPSYPLQMASGAHATEGGVWTNASSRALKKDIRDLPAADAAAALEQLRPVTYSYKRAPDETHVGFIAEDVPELVAEPDRSSLSPMDIAAVLTRVVKDQEEQIRTLEARVAELESLSRKNE